VAAFFMSQIILFCCNIFSFIFNGSKLMSAAPRDIDQRQIVRETTLAPYDFLKSNGRPKRRVEDPEIIAWKLTTGVYYKDGGRPWQLADVRPGVCYDAKDNLKLFRPGRYPIVRASALMLADDQAFLWTMAPTGHLSGPRNAQPGARAQAARRLRIR
jgi:hypothetical protein